MAKADKVAQASDYQVQLAKAADLVPYARNTRKHSDAQVAKIMASLVEFGFTKPVLVDANGIVAGHGTTQAALRLYEKGRTINTPSGKALPEGYIPILDCTGWSKAQRQAYIIADNAIAEASDWDTDLLKVEITELEALKFNTDLLGFDPGELSEMLYPGVGSPDGGGSGEEQVPDGYVEQYGVVVTCRDAAHQEEVFNLLQEQGFNVKIVVT